jgi:hypothetical protein
MNLTALLPAAKAGANAVATQAPAAVKGLPTLGANNPTPSTLDQINAGITASLPAAPAAPASPAPMAFDPQYEATKNQINAGLAGLQSSSDLQTQRAGEDYNTAVGTASKANTQNLSNLQNRLANQGIGYSGINISEQGRIGEDYQTQLGSLRQGKVRTLEDIQRDFADKQTAYQNQLSQAEIDRGTRETTRQTTAAADEAAALTAKTTADTNRQWLNTLSTTLTSLVQPQATPTGQMALPPTNPSTVIQKALQTAPPPAAKTPQQQAVDVGADPKLMQSLLQTLGFDPGPVDGIMGIKTQQALARWKQSVGLPATADLNGEIWQNLNLAAQAKMKPAAGGPKMAITGPGQSTQQLAQGINNRIATNGYNPQFGISGTPLGR